MFCQHCGSAAPENARFCGTCGRAVAIAAVPTADNRVSRHIRLLAILWMAGAGLKLMGALGVLFAGNVILPLVSRSAPELPGFVPSLVSWIGWAILFAALPALAAGIGLFNHEPWARTLALVMGFFALLSPLLGTALGVYTLWVLLPARSESEYQSLARAA